MYEGLGYSVLRRLRVYCDSLGVGGAGDEEDAFGVFSCAQYSLFTKYLELDMRKPLSRDPKRRSVRPNERDIIVSVREVLEYSWQKYKRRLNADMVYIFNGGWFRIRNGCQRGKLFFIEGRQCLFIRTERSQIESDFLRSRREPIVFGL